MIVNISDHVIVVSLSDSMAARGHAIFEIRSLKHARPHSVVKNRTEQGSSERMR